jgi:hypothetical protein
MFVGLVMAPRGYLRGLITHSSHFRPLGLQANLNDSNGSLKSLTILISAVGMHIPA